jgi:4-amino-4-deoxy-L-arabinose transferase-like glycosyltransferase
MFWRSDSPGTSRWWVRAMWLCFGLGFFTKGPPALLPLLAIIVFAVGLTGRRRLFDLAGILLFLAAGFWWYVVVSLRNPGLLGYWVHDEILGRNLTDEFHRNPQWYIPFTIYVPALVFGLGPWLVEAVRGVRREFATPQADRTPLWGHDGRRRWLLTLWIALPLVILSLSKSRLVLYVLPLSAPLALATAAAARRAGNRCLVALTAASVAFCLAGKASMPLVDRHRNAKCIHDAAVAAGGLGARYALLDESGFYGVQFYFDGNIERVSTASGRPWADRDLQSVIGDIESERLAERFVFITHSAGAAAVETALANRRLRGARTQVYGWEIVTVDRDPSPR